MADRRCTIRRERCVAVRHSTAQRVEVAGGLHTNKVPSTTDTWQSEGDGCWQMLTCACLMRPFRSTTHRARHMLLVALATSGVLRRARVVLAAVAVCAAVAAFPLASICERWTRVMMHVSCR